MKIDLNLLAVSPLMQVVLRAEDKMELEKTYMIRKMSQKGRTYIYGGITFIQTGQFWPKLGWWYSDSSSDKVIVV